MSRTITLLAALGVLAGLAAGLLWPTADTPTSQPPTATRAAPSTGMPQLQVPGGPLARFEDGGYYFRLKIALTYRNAPLAFDIVVGCGVRATTYMDKTSTREVMLVAPHYYVERVAGGHAIGVRPPQACAGHTSDNGGIPPDLMPSMFWYESADDLSSSILYVTEDAYEGPLARFKLVKASIHKATAAEFRDWVASPQYKNLYRLFDNNTRARPSRGYPTLQEAKAAGNRYPPPVDFVGQCRAAQRWDLPEKVREFIRPFWPAHKPRYWRPDRETSDKIHKFLKHPPFDARHEYCLQGRPYEHYKWEISPPHTDGLPTRAGGGMISDAGSSSASGDVFPISSNTEVDTYDPNILAHKTIKWNIATDRERLKGLAYRRGPLWGIGVRDQPGYFKKTFFPPFEETMETVEIDGSAVEGGLKPAQLRIHLAPPYWVFERDERLYRTRTYN